MAREVTTCLTCECAGCGAVVFVTATIGDTTNGEEVEVLHPPRSRRQRPRWLNSLGWSSMLRDAKYSFLTEIYEALDVDSLRLSILGIRSLVEHVMLQQLENDHGSFSKNLAAFHGAGHISNPQLNALKTVIELGHAVTHRAHSPTEEQVLAALDVTESIIQSIYVDGHSIARAVGKLPERRGVRHGARRAGGE